MAEYLINLNGIWKVPQRESKAMADIEKIVTEIKENIEKIDKEYEEKKKKDKEVK